jgi:hypothetical protein
VRTQDAVEPPHDVNAEMAVVSTMILYPEKALPICAQAGLRREMFYIPALSTVYQELLDVWDSGGKIELISFTDRLRFKGVLEAIGGAAALTDISLFADKLHNFAPGIADLSFRIELIHAAYVRRQIIADAEKTTQRALDPDPNADMNAVLDEIVSRATSLYSTHGRNGAIPQVEDAATAINQPITLPPDVIEGILHLGGKLVFGGGSKSFKTWLLIDLGISVATGSPWLNGYTTTKGRVLYINLELPKAFCDKRIQTICDERQITLGKGMLDLWHLRGHAMHWPELKRRIHSGVYALIIIDPIYKILLGRDEIKASDIALAMNELEELAVRTGAAVAFGAHYSKGNQALKESIDRISGSGVYARDPDSILTFTSHEQHDCFTVEMTLRNHPPQKSFVVRWDYPLFIADNLLDPAKLKQAGRPALHSRNDILELIDEPMFAREIVKAAKEEHDIPRRCCFEYLASLKEDGLVVQPQKRGRYERVPNP